MVKVLRLKQKFQHKFTLCRKSMQNINQYGGQPNEPLVLPPGGNSRLYGITAVQECPRGRFYLLKFLFFKIENYSSQFSAKCNETLNILCVFFCWGGKCFIFLNKNHLRNLYLRMEH